MRRYRDWIEELRSAHPDIPGPYEDAASRILDRLRAAAERMDAGVELLASGDQELDAFRWANLAVAIQMRRGKSDLGGTRRVRDTLDTPTPDYLTAGYRWRPFQLAFILSALASGQYDERLWSTAASLVCPRMKPALSACCGGTAR